jgi:hypothetical protein
MIRGWMLCTLLLGASALLSACGKTIGFTEEVKLASARTILVKREALLEPRMSGLQLRQTWQRSRLTILKSDVPPWEERLFAMYLGAAGQDEYLLVAFIPNAVTCYERGRPHSKYVAFLGDKRGWREVEVPKDLEGQAANVLLGFERYGGADKPFSMERKAELN